MTKPQTLAEQIRALAIPDDFTDEEATGYWQATHDAAALTDAAPSYQSRVKPWLDACFGPEIAGDKTERNHRFLEEALELVQSGGCTASEAHQLVDYVYGRPVGEMGQEVGGVMNTLAALCLAYGRDMHDDGETELARVWTMVEKIRAKQAAKPKHSPLPGYAATTTPAEQAGDAGRAWRVKPLVWTELGNGRAYRAESPLFGSIRVEAYYSGGFHVLWSVPGFCDSFTPGLYPTAELAQAAAQADYAARITAALEPDPTPALGWRAMQTAAAEHVRSMDWFMRISEGHIRGRGPDDYADAILAMTGPTDEQLMADAVKLPEVREFAAIMKEVLRVSDRSTPLWNSARAALAKIGEAK